ncbi:hypothetical protein [Lichenibacterium minor]|nr:hypothetical protein [Lichenibacterium minor]
MEQESSADYGPAARAALAVLPALLREAEAAGAVALARYLGQALTEAEGIVRRGDKRRDEPEGRQHVAPGISDLKGRKMAKTKKLAKFTITEAGEDFKLHIEDEAGHVLELVATRDQVDVIDDALEELLEKGGSADQVEG